MSDEKRGLLDLGSLLLRLALGAIMIAHGWGKVEVGFENFAGVLESMGVPLPSVMSPVVIVTEIGGGLAVILGVFARLGALGIAVTMLVGIFKVHWSNGFFIPLKVDAAGPVPWGFEYNIALLSMALFIVLNGPGRWSLYPKGFRRKGGDN